jgi:HEAT repeat protein
MTVPRISMLSGIRDDDYSRLVACLGVEHRSKEARSRLMDAGNRALSALRCGLRDPDPRVRIGCCIVLDHHLDDEAIPELIENLRHDHPDVRAWALHALGCDRCKEGSCRPAESFVVPLAAAMLTNDPSHKVRERAAGLLGPAVHRSPEALAALRRAHQNDPCAVVRKIAGWYVPGGPRYERLEPKVPRTTLRCRTEAPR